MEGCELAVLNACNTNESGHAPGEIPMSSAFLMAGARRVVASQWTVDENSACIFAEEFLRQVAEDWKAGKMCNYAAAMAAARQEIRDDTEHPKWAGDPFYWAPFVLIGPPP